MLCKHTMTVSIFELIFGSTIWVRIDICTDLFRYFKKQSLTYSMILIIFPITFLFLRRIILHHSKAKATRFFCLLINLPSVEIVGIPYFILHYTIPNHMNSYTSYLAKVFPQPFPSPKLGARTHGCISNKSCTSNLIPFTRTHSYSFLVLHLY